MSLKASNGALISFSSGTVEFAKTIYTATLLSGEWPGSSELLDLANGSFQGSPLATWFGGSIAEISPTVRQITIFTD